MLLVWSGPNGRQKILDFVCIQYSKFRLQLSSIFEYAKQTGKNHHPCYDRC